MRNGIVATVCLSVALLTGCGGGGSSEPASPAPSSSTPMPPSTPAPPGSPAATAPSITTQPTNASTIVGDTATFTVVASGTGPLSYQWQRNGTAVTGATTPSYTTSALQVADDGVMFSVVVSNSAGSVTSASAKLSVRGPLPADVATFKNDNGRTGQYLVEKNLTPANVNSTSFGLLRELVVDGKVDAQPLYLSRLLIGDTAHNVVFVATENASVYAFDADTGAQIWKVTLLGSGEVPSDMQGCDLIEPTIGITSTPVIDRTAGANGALYLVAMSLDSTSKYHQRVHALDITTGTELPNSPAEISGTYPKFGGVATFDAGRHQARAALLLVNGTLYTSWGSHCDDPPYSGWIIALDQSTLSPAGILNVAPNSGLTTGLPPAYTNHYSTNGPSIWMSGDGPAADAAGNVYFLAGNGRFETDLDANGFPFRGDYGNSFVKATKAGSNLAVSDYFALFNTQQLSAADEDLGSGGEMLLPDLTDSTGTVKHLVVGAGKDGNIYLVDRDNMGKFDSAGNNIWQQISGQLGGRVFSSPTYFNGMLYYAAEHGTLRAFSITAAKISPTPVSRTAITFTFPGTSAAISADGNANAILWAPENTSPGVLHAYDPADLTHELYNSNQASAGRDQFGPGNKFITPTIADGRVLIGTTHSVAVFGLLP